MRRRALLGLGVLGGVEALRQRVDEALDPVTTSWDADEWERAADVLAREVGHVPPDLILPGLLSDLREANERLNGASEPLRRRMARVCAQIAALTAITLCDLGQESSARFWRTAVRAADQSGDMAMMGRLREAAAWSTVQRGRRSA